MLQETHLSEKEYLKLKREWVDLVFSSSFERGRKRGVAILFNKSVYFNHTETVRDKNGRNVLVKGDIGGTKVTLFFKDIATFISRHNGTGGVNRRGFQFQLS